MRRGPSDWARLSLWHTDTDAFEHGQWLKGRVYERRCDVSADGCLFVAFIRQSGGRPRPPPAADTWVAISRPPYFTALALWFIGGTYHTGGFFVDAGSVWPGYQEKPPDVGALPDWLQHRAPRDLPYIDGTPEWTDRTVLFNRLLRDGWQRVEDGLDKTTWQRRNPGGPNTLRVTQTFESFEAFGGPYTLDLWLQPDDGGGEVALGTATWADWDQSGRLVLAREGRLLRLDDRGDLVEVGDFNAQTPEPLTAPDWALDWPPPPTGR